MSLTATEVAVMDRRNEEDRRAADGDRRQADQAIATERRQGERRKQRRRQIDPTTCERDYSGEEIEFMQALDAYKRRNGRMFPTCSEVLEVIRSLGYAKLPADEFDSADSAAGDFSAAAAE